MIRLDKEGLTTDDPVIASGFLHCKIKGCKLTGISVGWADGKTRFYLQDGGKDITQLTITIPYPTVLALIQPIEGKAFVAIHPLDSGELAPSIMISYQKDWGEGTSARCYHKRVLNIVTTRAELRELIDKCQEAKG